MKYDDENWNDGDEVPDDDNIIQHEEPARNDENLGEYY